jgi:CRISPR-associated endoribonuclease Cas6
VNSDRHSSELALPNQGFFRSNLELLHVCPLRFSFVAQRPVYFPEGKAGNVLRGALGTILRRIVCVPHCRDAENCPEPNCAFRTVFAPKLERGPSGLADPPRPFVLRALHLDGLRIAEQEAFSFDLHLFSQNGEALPLIILAMRQAFVAGLGPGRAPVRLEGVKRNAEGGFSAEPVYAAGGMLSGEPRFLTIFDDPRPKIYDKLTLRYATPTALKHEGRVLRNEAPFAVVWGRLRDRLSALRLLYGVGPFAAESFHELNDAAAAVRVVEQDLRWRETSRRSARTGQTHPLDGFTGKVTYAGDLGRFVPWLRAGYWAGIGRHCVWGGGVIMIEGCQETTPSAS